VNSGGFRRGVAGDVLRAFFLAIVCLLATTVPTAAFADSMVFRKPTEDDSARFARMVLRGGQDQIYASGEIQIDTAQRLREFVRVEGVERAKVHFDSPGGSLIGGLLLGEVIRELGFDTDIAIEGENGPAMCASACAYAFAGGRNRFFLGGQSRLGLHQFYGSGDNVADVGDTQELSAAIIGYLGRMGVSPNAFVRAADARSSEMVWLEPADAISLGLANNGTQPTTAEIKLAGMQPYLRLEQVHHDVTTRVLILCHQRQIEGMFGIVTNREITASRYATTNKSYLAFDDVERLVSFGQTGLRAEDSVLWVRRPLNRADLALLGRTRSLEVWTENGGAFRWGGNIELSDVQSDIARFVAGCAQS
jgi:hypothetical protein